VLYTGRLIDGTIFDHRNDPANPLSFVLGQQAVIEGWEECMPLLNKGSVARMVIPSDLAYGNEEIGLLKPYSTLIFDVEITDIRKPVKPNP
jgi:FKBP-type peptidyl-prolyl cis-trans isomerase